MFVVVVARELGGGAGLEFVRLGDRLLQAVIGARVAGEHAVVHARLAVLGGGAFFLELLLVLEDADHADYRLGIVAVARDVFGTEAVGLAARPRARNPTATHCR